ncbi:hypothetical protein NMY22_g2995 [Coprinellus aureogranulatus]|nr:hypothetical protein NMY22_g2995 [Coprinellus aureogranulatus]
MSTEGTTTAFSLARNDVNLFLLYFGSRIEAIVGWWKGNEGKVDEHVVMERVLREVRFITIAAEIAMFHFRMLPYPPALAFSSACGMLASDGPGKTQKTPVGVSAVAGFPLLPSFNHNWWSHGDKPLTSWAEAVQCYQDDRRHLLNVNLDIYFRPSLELKFRESQDGALKLIAKRMCDSVVFLCRKRLPAMIKELKGSQYELRDLVDDQSLRFKSVSNAFVGARVKAMRVQFMTDTVGFVYGAAEGCWDTADKSQIRIEYYSLQPAFQASMRLPHQQAALFFSLTSIMSPVRFTRLRVGNPPRYRSGFFQPGIDVHIPSADSIAPSDIVADWHHGLDVAQMCKFVALQVYLTELGPENLPYTDLEVPQKVVDYLPDIIQAARVCADAVNNSVNYDGIDIDTLETVKPKAFSRLQTRLDTEPLLALTDKDEVLFWSLPGVLSQRLQRIAEQAFVTLRKRHPDPRALIRGRASAPLAWDPSLYRSTTPRFGKGGVTFDFQHLLPNSDEAMMAYKDYMDDMAPVLGILAAISAITIPLQSEQGWEWQRRLSECARIGSRQMKLEFVKRWIVPFETFDIEANMAKLHQRNTDGMAKAYLLIAEFGEHTNGSIVYPTLDARCTANPGTVSVFPHALLHGMPQVNGERFRITLETWPALRQYDYGDGSYNRYVSFLDIRQRESLAWSALGLDEEELILYPNLHRIPHMYEHQ